MNRKVKRYDPINSDGTCGMCIEDADYGAYVEYADYAALEAELAKLRAGQEPVASISWTNDDPEWKLKMLAEPVHPPAVPLKLYTAPQPSAVPDGWKLVPDEPTLEMLDAAIQDGICVDGKPVWKRDVVFQAKWRYQQMLSAAPAAVLGAGWIPVSERLPEPETDVLVRGVRRNEVMHNVAGVFNGEWSSQETEDLIRGEVTHWMPLPESPAIAAAQEGKV